MTFASPGPPESGGAQYHVWSLQQYQLPSQLELGSGW
jgi:hypothetical protein